MSFPSDSTGRRSARSAAAARTTTGSTRPPGARGFPSRGSSAWGATFAREPRSRPRNARCPSGGTRLGLVRLHPAVLRRGPPRRRRRRRTGSDRSPPRRAPRGWVKSPGWAPRGRAAPPDRSPSGAAATSSLESPAAARRATESRSATKKTSFPGRRPRRRRAPRSRRASPPPPPPPSPTRPTPRRSSSDRGRSDGSGGSRRISSRPPGRRGGLGGLRRQARLVARGTRSPNPSTASWTRCRSARCAITCAWRTRRRLRRTPRAGSPRR